MGSREDVVVTAVKMPGMDCPSEEKMIRLAMESIAQVQGVEVNLGEREINVFHIGNAEEFLGKLESLGLGAKLKNSRPISDEESLPQLTDPEQEAHALRLLLLINGVMFILELSIGLYAQSTGLIADSLDMFADASVYGIALLVVGKTAVSQLRAAHLSGGLQLLLALGVVVEVIRRMLYGSEPISLLMIGFGTVALIANITCLFVIYRHRDGGAHMKASWIFSANDVIANAGVIFAGALVYLTGSNYPDLVIGLMIGLLVLSGAIRILRIS